MYLVTGGAGFIGSNIVAALSRDSRVVVSDWLGRESKWRNIAKHDLYDLVFPEQLEGWLATRGKDLTAIIHMGAISATTEQDADRIVASNLQLSLRLWDWCVRNACPLIFASSAAVYGDGGRGFDDRANIQATSLFRPLNPYGWSKLAFDRRVLRALDNNEGTPPKWAGLRFFNVYGPNEYHKAGMRSVIGANYPRLVTGEPMRLFRSYRNDYEDGCQKRDFVFVEDCVAVVQWMLRRPFASGLYNVGTGTARTWLDLARAMFAAMGVQERIEFIDMPDLLRNQYQYFTEAPITKLREAGYDAPFQSLEDGISTFIRRYLATDDPYV
jgi:ADP-L-glycero-D-manno-heptose 6-epimerase